MASYIFQKIADLGKLDGIDRNVRQRDARTWFRNTAQSITRVDRNKLLNDPAGGTLTTYIDEESIGSMYSFFYDPKHKKTLPYYDKFPLVFVIGPKDKGFLGLNMHYLPPVLRAKLMNELHKITNNNKYNDTTKLKVSYELLASTSRFRYFAPCIKHYLFEHVRSKFLKIDPYMWDTALFLPTEQFVKMDKEKVWKQSKAMVV